MEQDNVIEDYYGDSDTNAVDGSSFNLLQQISRLRAGTPEEKHAVALWLSKYCHQNEDKRNEILSTGALHLLIGALPDEAAAHCIVLLTAGLDDAELIFKYSNGIHSALKIVLAGSSNTKVQSQEGVAQQRSPRYSVAIAFTHIIITIRHAWREVSSSSRTTTPTTTSMAWIRKNAEIDNAIEEMVSLAITLAQTSDDLDDEDEKEASILSAFSLSNLAEESETRVLLVNLGLLQILEHYLTSDCRDLQRYATSILASLSQRDLPRPCSRGNHHRSSQDQAQAAAAAAAGGGGVESAGAAAAEDHHLEEEGGKLDVYTLGFLDARILASNVLFHLLPLASAIEVDVSLNVARTLAYLSLHPQNRSVIIRMGGISSLVLLLSSSPAVAVSAAADSSLSRELSKDESSVVEYALMALYHLAMEAKAGRGTATKGVNCPCNLIFKEGGLQALASLLQNSRTHHLLKPSTRGMAIQCIAIISQYSSCRLGIFQVQDMVETLLTVAMTVARELEAVLEPALQQELLVQAAHVAFILANLSQVQDPCYQRQLVSRGSVPVLLYMSRIQDEEVLSHGLKALADLCLPLIRGFYKKESTGEKPVQALRSVEESQDEQLRMFWSNETLQTMMALLKSDWTSPTIQTEAMRTIAMLSLVPDYGALVVHGILKELLRLAVDPSSGKELRGLAEQTLVNIGFEGGLKDFEACGTDQLLLDWWEMERLLEDQRLAVNELSFAVEAMMASVEDTYVKPKLSSVSGAAAMGPPSHRLDRNLLSPSIIPRATTISSPSPLPPPSSQQQPSLASTTTTVVSEQRGGLGAGLSSVIKEVANLRLRGLLMTCLNPAGASSSSSSSSASPSPPADQDEEFRILDSSRRNNNNITASSSASSSVNSGSRKESLLSCLSRRITTDSGDGGEDSCFPSMFSLSSTVALPEVGSLSFNLQRLMDVYFPSKLTQREVIPLTVLAKHQPGETEEFFRVDGHWNGGSSFHRSWSKNEIIRGPSFRALILPSRRYFSFRREGRVLSKIIKKHINDTHFWSLSFHNSSFEGEFSQSLLERLNVLPKIKSLVFYSSRPQQGQGGDTSLAYLVAGVPTWIRHIAFDGVLNRDALVILSHILKTKGLHFSTTSPSPSPGLGLIGLAVRNHYHLRPDDFLPLLEFFRYQKEQQQHQQPQPQPQPQQDQEGAGTPTATEEEEEEESILEENKRELEVSTHWDAAGGVGQGCLSRQPSLLGNYVGIQYLDLHGNKLGDMGCTEVLKAVKHSITLISLDLSSNQIKGGSTFTDAMLEYMGRSGTGIAGGGGGCPSTADVWLRTLLLDENNLQSKFIQRFLVALENDSSLETLSLADNHINDSKATMEGFRNLLRRNKTLFDLSLANNRIGVEGGRELLFGLLENQTMRFLRLKGNAGLKAEEKDLIERQLVGNRHRFYAPISKSQARKQRATVGAPIPALGFSRSVTVASSGSGTAALPSSSSSSSSSCSSSCQTLFPRGDCPVHKLPYSHSSTTTQTVEHHQRSYSEPVPDFEKDLKNDAPPDEMIRYYHDTKQPAPSSAPGESNHSSSNTNNRESILTVLFSAPLAWRDLNGNLHPIEMLYFDQERELLTQAFLEAECDYLPRFDFATTEKLRSAVTLGARALHYSGHGHKNQLIFEDGAGGLQFISNEMLKSLCMADRHKLELVVVSSCYSRLAGEAFVGAGVNHVVCVNLEATLTDSAALAFTKAFYLSLAVGGSVQTSFEIGRQAVAASPNVPNSIVEQSKFLLLPEDQDHGVSIFPPERRGSGESALFSGYNRGSVDVAWTLQQQAQAHLPTPPEDFLGREVDMYRAINACLNRRLITLLGAAGVGKSALSSAVCHYMALRRYIPEGIVFVRCEGVHVLEELIQTIIQAVSRRLPSLTGGTTDVEDSRQHPPPHHHQHDNKARTDLEKDEEWLYRRLLHAKVLLVLDHVQELQQGSDGINVKIFLKQLFDLTRSVKVMVTTTQALNLHSLPGVNVGETLISVNPLSFRNTVRLFSRLCPHLHTARDRRIFLETLVPLDQGDVTIVSRDITPRTLYILEKLGEGYPSRILRAAYQISEEDVLKLLGEINV